MQDFAAADELARTMVDIGQANGVATSALVTRMDNVLGLAAGNALEVQESLDVLAGGGPPDVIDLTLALADEMLRLVGIDADPAAVLASGEALETFEAMVAAQGGDLQAELPQASERMLVTAAQSGYVQAIEARGVGVAAWRLGAGRARKEDAVSMTAGVRCLVKPGDRVDKGQPIVELHTDEAARLDAAQDLVEKAITIDAGKPVLPPIVIERVGRDLVA